MNNLLRAGFTRLWKNKVFWLEVLFMFGLGVYATVVRYIRMQKPDYPYSMDDILHSTSQFIPVTAAVFTALYIGAEYSFGTLRNKLTVGCTRSAVYLSNLIVCTTSQLLVYLVYMVPILAVGFPLTMNSLSTPADDLVKLTLLAVAAIIATCAVLTLMSMLIPSRSNAVVAEMVAMLLLLMAGGYLGSRLDEEEYWSGYEYNEVTNQVEYYENEPNEYYIGGTKRVIFEFLYDLLPSGQLQRVIGQDVTMNYPVLAVYDLAIFGTATAVGLVIFGRKDLR